MIKFAPVVEQKHSIAVFDEMNGGPAGVGNGLVAFPDALAGLGIEAPQFAVAIDAIDILTVEIGRGDDRVQGIGVPLARAAAAARRLPPPACRDRAGPSASRRKTP